MSLEVWTTSDQIPHGSVKSQVFVPVGIAFRIHTPVRSGELSLLLLLLHARKRTVVIRQAALLMLGLGFRYEWMRAEPALTWGCRSRRRRPNRLRPARRRRHSSRSGSR